MKSIDGARVISLLQAFSVLALSADESPEVAYFKNIQWTSGAVWKFRRLIMREIVIGYEYWNFIVYTNIHW